MGATLPTRRPDTRRSGGTAKQKQILRTLGCTEMQGYLFSAAKTGPEVRGFFGPHR